MAMAATAAGDATRPMTSAEKKVIFASSLGTVFEWYDFYLFGTLAVIIGTQFFSVNDANGNPLFSEATRNIFALLAFAAGFLVRPFGALVFGRLGDLVGRKYTFLVTILIMGLSTFVVGLLPGAKSWGIWAPIILISFRLLQGLALGGEYGGAATYVAEHAPHGRRGFYTSWIQTTATLGLFLSLLVILFTRTKGMDMAIGWGWIPDSLAKDPKLAGLTDVGAMAAALVPDNVNAGLLKLREAAFGQYGWRVPFLVSVVLLGISVWIRLQLSESPAFLKMRDEGTISKAPLTEAFGNWDNAKIALIALLGLTAGQGVVWYTGQFYALFFLTALLKVDGPTANYLIAWSLAIGTVGFVFFGWLSDKIGRKPIILAGCLIAALSFFPIFKQIGAIANPTLANAVENVKVTVVADPADCGSLFDPIGIAKFSSSCDLLRRAVSGNSARYTVEAGAAGDAAKAKVGAAEVASYDAAKVRAAAVAAEPDEAKKAKAGDLAVAAAAASLGKSLSAALAEAGYPKAGDANIVKMADLFDIGRAQVAKLIGLLLILVIFVTMVYGPIAAALVELFPTRIRYTSMSLPYHIGNGWFGGLLPATALAMVAQTGDIYFGLWYPIIFAVMTFVIGVFFVPETKDRDIYAMD